MKIISSGRGIHSPEFYKKKLKSRRIRRTLTLVAIFLSVILATFFFRWEKFLINEVVIAEAIAVDRGEIMKLVNAELSGYYFFVIPKNNAFLYQRKLIKAKLLEEFPRFKILELKLEGFDKLAVSAEERAPFALYCIDLGNCFFLDNEGFIFASAPSFSDGVYFVYKTAAPIENPLGKSFLSSNEFRDLAKFLESLPALGANSSELKIEDGDYRLLLTGGGEIVWRRESSLALIYSNLEAFLSDEAISSQPSFLDQISRLDLRTDNKVFWKLK